MFRLGFRLGFRLRLKLASRVAALVGGVENVSRRPERLRAQPCITKYRNLVKFALSSKVWYKRLFLYQGCRKRGNCKPTSGSADFGLEKTCSTFKATLNGLIWRILSHGLNRVAWPEVLSGKSRRYRHKLPRRW